MKTFKIISQQIGTLLLLMLPGIVLASSGGDSATSAGQDFTNTTYGIAAVAVFVIAYGLVIGEEALHLRKSIPVIIGAGVIWTLVGMAYAATGDTHYASSMVEHNILEFSELFLFLLAAMTFVNTMEERQVFAALRATLVSRGLSLRTIFWITGLLAFLISPIADNLTTALLMAAVVMAVGKGNNRFVAVACINIVVAANAGGAFSPFGDITTLMVWQKGIVQFDEFFVLFLPSLVNWLIPAFFMSLAVSKEIPEKVDEEIKILHGGYQVIFLFLLTIVMAVMAHNFLHMPPVLGMMTGLGLLKLYGYYLSHGAYYKLYAKHTMKQAEAKSKEGKETEVDTGISGGHYGESVHRNEQPPVMYGAETASSKAIKSAASDDESVASELDIMRKYDVYNIVARAEWDTLMFFYGVVLCVGGLSALGYLAVVSDAMYTDLGATWANVLVGVLSAVVDNIPVMFAVLTMSPEMGLDQWLLVTLTAGVGGSLLSVGSAAGVALMGQARGIYTFFSHLKWSWAISLGYAGSIMVHLVLNGDVSQYTVQGNLSKVQSQTKHVSNQTDEMNKHSVIKHNKAVKKTSTASQATLDVGSSQHITQKGNDNNPGGVNKRKKLISDIFYGKWSYRDNPIGYFPSDITNCQKPTNNTISCESIKQSKKIGDDVITYITTSTLYQFKNSKNFKVRYSNNVLSIDGKKQTGRKKKSKHRLICNLMDSGTIRCLKDNSRTLIFKS